MIFLEAHEYRIERCEESPSESAFHFKFNKKVEEDQIKVLKIRRLKLENIHFIAYAREKAIWKKTVSLKENHSTKIIKSLINYKRLVSR